MTTFIRVTKHEARRLFKEGKPVYFCPHKMRPGTPFNAATAPNAKEWLERYNNGNEAFSRCLANFNYYNANSYETGYYAHFYVER